MITKYRRLEAKDLEKVFDLWVGVAKIKFQDWEKENLKEGIFRDQIIGTIAQQGEKLVGAAVASHNGMLAQINHLAVVDRPGARMVAARMIKFLCEELERSSPSRRVIASTDKGPLTDPGVKVIKLGRKQRWSRTDEVVYQLDLRGGAKSSWGNQKDEAPPANPAAYFLWNIYRRMSPLMRKITVAVVLLVALAFAVPEVVALVNVYVEIIPKRDLLLPDRKMNVAGAIQILSREDYIDLDALVPVPQHVLEREYDEGEPLPKISPTIRTTKLTLRKNSDCNEYLYHATSSYKTPPDVVCLSSHGSSLKRVSWKPALGESNLAMFELRVDIAGESVGKPFVVKWNRVGWNKYAGGQDNWWTSSRLNEEVKELKILVDFPTQSGIDIDNIQLKLRSSTHSSWVVFPDRSEVKFSKDQGLFEWRIPNAAANTEYAVFWNVDLTKSSDDAILPEGG